MIFACERPTKAMEIHLSISLNQNPSGSLSEKRKRRSEDMDSIPTRKKKGGKENTDLSEAKQVPFLLSHLTGFLFSQVTLSILKCRSFEIQISHLHAIQRHPFPPSLPSLSVTSTAQEMAFFLKLKEKNQYDDR